MQHVNRIFQIAILGCLIMPGLSHAGNIFVGFDAVKMETRLVYAQTETYDFASTRLRLGREGIGYSFGIEYIPGQSDQQLDPFGDVFELDVGDSIGLYTTLGEPVYVKFAWSSWDTKYTDFSTGQSDTGSVKAFDFGLGFNIKIGNVLTFYADYTIRYDDVLYSDFFGGEIDYKTKILSLGVNYLF